MPPMTPMPTRLAALALAAACGMALAGCTSSDGGAASASSSLPMSTPTPSNAAPATPAPDAPASAGESAPAESAAATPLASDPADPAYTVADAIMDQLNTIPPSALTSELVTIAVSPQLRQVAAQYDVTTAIDVMDDDVSVNVQSKRLTCRVSVADPPETTLALSCKKR